MTAEPLTGEVFDPPPQDERDLAGTLRLQKVLAEAGLKPRTAPIRTSGIKLLHECPRKHMLRVRIGLTPIVEKSFALRTGKIYHWFTEEMHLGSEFPLAGRVASERLTKEIDHWKDISDDSLLLPDGTSLDNLIAESEQSFSLAQVMAEIGADHFFGSVFDGWEVLDVEKPIETTVRGIPGVVRCKPDAIFLRPTDGSLLIVDDKTHTGSTQARAASLSFELQPRIERLCVAAVYPEYKPAFFLHNIIRKTGRRFPAKKYADYAEYLKAVREDYDDQNIKDPTDPPLLQSLLALTGPILTDELHVILAGAASACRARCCPARFHRNDDMCLGRFKNSTCPYLSLCKSSMSQWPDIIEHRFVQSFREDEEDEE